MLLYQIPHMGKGPRVLAYTDPTNFDGNYDIKTIYGGTAAMPFLITGTH